MVAKQWAFERAVLVRADLPGREVSIASGTIVGPRLVLTAAHAVFGDDGRPLGRLRLGRPDQLFTGMVLWPESYDAGHGPLEWDAALIEITDGSWAPFLSAVWWGRITGRTPITDCTATGFPRAKVDVERAVARDSDQIRASISPASNVMTGLFDVDVNSAVPRQLEGLRSPWSGASGAGVFANGLLIGVLIADERRAYDGDRLCAVPVNHLAASESFRNRIYEGGAGLRSLAEIRSVELTGLLSAPAGDASRRKERFSPASLLRADAEVVPFDGRHDLLGDLKRWCVDDDIDLDLRLLAGPGGVGKTRLARHLAQTLADWPDSNGTSRWLTGFLEADNTGMAAQDVSRIAETVVPLLVVVDRAETREQDILQVMRALRAADAGPATRVLLTARSAGAWWVELTDQLSQRGTVRNLSELYGPDAVEASFESGLTWFAIRLASLLPDVDWSDVSQRVSRPRDLSHPRYRSALTLQLAVLTALLDAAEHRQADDGELAEEGLLRHERHYWRDVAKRYRLDLGAETLSDLIAVVALAGAATRDEAAPLLRVVPGLFGASGDTLAGVDKWLRDMYPPSAGRWWASLQPDRVAEYQVATRLLGDATLLKLVLGASSRTQILQVMTVLARTLVNPALSTDQTAALGTQLRDALLDEPGKYGPAAIDVATQAPDPSWFVTALDHTATHAGPDQLEALVEALPHTSLALSSLAERLTSRLVIELRRLVAQQGGGAGAHLRLVRALNDHFHWLVTIGRPHQAAQTISEAVVLRRHLAADCPDESKPDLATLLSNEASALSAVGRHVQALEVATEAATLRRQTDPEPVDRQGTSTPYAAISYNALAAQLSVFSYPEDQLAAAAEAVTAYRDLVKDCGDAFEPHLALSLNSQARTLAILGRRDHALQASTEAVALHRRLAAARPDTFGADLAASLNSHAVAFARLSRHREASEAISEAVALYRRLAADAPDAFTPDLALSLTNLAGTLEELGRREEALDAVSEAVVLYRELAIARPDVLAPEYANSLDGQAVALGELGRPREALAVAAEAVDIRRRLAASLPGAFTRGLAGTLSTLSNQLAELGRPEEALEANTEAVTIYRRIAAPRPDAFKPDLAMALNNQADRLKDVGDRDGALAAVTESVILRRQLSAGQPEVFARHLAASLYTQAEALSEVGHHAGALEAINEAVAIRRRLVDELPEAFAAQLARSLIRQAIALAHVGRSEDSSKVITEAVIRYRELAAARPAAFDADLAAALNTQASQLSALGARDQAVDVGAEAVSMFRRLSADNPDGFAAHLAGTLANHSHDLAAAARYDEAMEAIAEAAGIYRQLAEMRPDTFSPHLAKVLNSLSRGLIRRGQTVQAREAIAEAVNISQALAVDYPEAFRPLLAMSLLNYANVLRNLGYLPQAYETGRYAVAIHRRLSAAQPDRFEPELARSLLIFGQILSENGRFEHALQADIEAVSIYRKLAKRWPAAYTEPLNGAVSCLLIDLADLGHDDESAQSELRRILGPDGHQNQRSPRR